MQKATRYISCQTCHKPAGDRHTKETGTCFDCSREIIAAGRRREKEKEAAQSMTYEQIKAAQDAEREAAQWYTCSMTETERQEVIGRSRLSYGLAPSWHNLSDISKQAIRARRIEVLAECERMYPGSTAVTA